MLIVKRLCSKNSYHFFLFGPRGTGKSTWLKQNYSSALYIDLLDEHTYRTLLARPERLLNIVAGSTSKTIIVDEVQRVPSILTAAHKLIEEHKDRQFIFTGSSARKLKKDGTDLLAGRAVLKKMYTFTASELKSDFNLENALSFGMLPVVFSNENKSDALEAYIALYLKEEVQMEGLTRNIGNFSRFLEIISFSHAQLLNTSEIARECAIGRKTVENYISILEDLLIAWLLPVFSKKAKRNLVAHSKFYFFDSGVFNTIRPKGPLDSPSDMHGPALEGLVLQHLMAWAEYSQKKKNIYFWRTKSGNEVDFIVYGEDSFLAIEVKNSASVRNKDLAGLKAFLQDYPQAKAFLLYRGAEKMVIDNITCMPCEDFLLSIIS